MRANRCQRGRWAIKRTMRASTTAAVLATLDEKLVQLSTRTATAKTDKEAYEKKFQATLKEVVEKQKVNKAPHKSTPQPPSVITEAGMRFIEQEKERQAREREQQREKAREKDQQEEEDKDRDSMDVDEPADGGKGKK